jgi:hypothetical protein
MLVRKTTAAAFGSRRAVVAGLMRLVAAALLALCAASAAHADNVAGCRKPPAKHAADTRSPIDIGAPARQLVAYRCFYYIKDMAAVLSGARQWIKQRAPQLENPAIVFDIDETSLSNWAQIYHNRFRHAASGPCNLAAAHRPCGDRAWELSARAVALAPTRVFYRIARTLRGSDGHRIAIFFITGRVDDPALRAATARNLRKVGYGNWTKLILRPRSSRGAVSIYKSGERKKIERRYTIIANIGDQYSDLIGDSGGDHAERCFKLPNPFYFIPPGLPEAGLKCLAH